MDHNIYATHTYDVEFNNLCSSSSKDGGGGGKRGGNHGDGDDNNYNVQESTMSYSV
jgi:hypothetical protein